MTTRSGPVPVSPKLELPRSRGALLLLTILLPQAQKFILGRRGSRWSGQYGAPRRVEMRSGAGGAGVLSGGAAQSVFLVFRAVERRVLAERDDAGDASTLTLHNIVSCSPSFVDRLIRHGDSRTATRPSALFLRWSSLCHTD